MSKRWVLMLAGTFAAVCCVGLVTFTSTPRAAGFGESQIIPPETKRDERPVSPALRLAMAELIETKDFQNPMTLKEALGYLYEHFLKHHGKEVPILVNGDGFREENPDADPIYDTQVEFPPHPRKVSVSTALRMILAKVKSANATFLIRPAFIEVTTFKRAQPDYQLVDASFFRRPLGEALDILAEQTGISIVLDARAGAKAGTPITASFPGDTSLLTAVRVLADMADLKVMVVDNLLYVTLVTNDAAFPPIEHRKLRKLDAAQ